MKKYIENFIVILFIFIMLILGTPMYALANTDNKCYIQYEAHVQDIGWQENKINGETAGTEGKSLRLEAIKINLKNAPETVKVKYRANVETQGWQEWKEEGEIAGTEGEGLKLEQIQIQLEENEEYLVKYRVHIQDIGWQEWKKDGEIAGIQGKRIEAIEIKLEEKEKKVRLFIETNANNQTYNNNTKEINISGWRMANFSNNQIKGYVDGKKIGEEAIVKYARADVISAIKDCGTEEQNPTPGFVVNVNLENLAEGKHTIKLEITTLKQEVIETYTCTFNINRQIQVSYSGHVQNIGWQGNRINGETAGTEGKSLRLEALKIKLENEPEKVKVKYRANVEKKGWQEWKAEGGIAGTEGESLKLEQIQIQLEETEEYTVMYRVHVQDIGWEEWKKDNEIAGTKGKRIEAIQIKLVKREKKARLFIETGGNNQTYYKDTSTISISGWKMANFSNNKITAYLDNKEIEKITNYARADVITAITDCGTKEQNPTPGFVINVNAEELSEGKHTIKINVETYKHEVIETHIETFNIDRQAHVIYEGHVQNVGWQGKVNEGNTAGTEGLGLRLEAMKIQLINAPEDAKIKYKAYVQGAGWQEWKTNGEIAGTVGDGLRLEVIKIELENLDKCTVEYRTYTQEKGWTDWYIDGEKAGIKGKRIEAIQIRIVPKYKRHYIGIDISHWQGTVDYNRVIASKKIDFMIARVGWYSESRSQFIVDSQFERNYNEAKKGNIPLGIYLYSYATNVDEAKREAENLIKYLNASNKKEYELPVFFDIEDATQETLSKETVTQIITTFCNIIKNAGYNPGIYANLNWYTNKIDLSQIPEDYALWIAHYDKNVTITDGIPDQIEKYAKTHDIWQYTQSGNIDGISGNVDFDVCYKKYF